MAALAPGPCSRRLPGGGSPCDDPVMRSPSPSALGPASLGSPACGGFKSSAEFRSWLRRDRAHLGVRLRQRHVPRAAGSQSGRMGGGGGGGAGGEGFWEGEEGKQTLDEIEELREIVKRREELEEQLKELEDQADVDASAAEASEALGPEEAAARAEARAEARAAARAQLLRDLLERRAQEQTAKRKEAQGLFNLGQRAYGRGMYDKSVQILEAALEYVESKGRLGGEIQLWLAMAYDANGQRTQCIDLYKKLENAHPLPYIRKKAYEMRYIAEAPKLKLTPEEILTVPILGQNYQSTQRTWSQMVRERRPRPKPRKAIEKSATDYWDDLEGWEPPKWEQSPYFWIALTLWLTLVGVALVFQ